MKIAIIGANGKAGSRIAAEAKNRGHEVTAIVRDGSKLADARTAVIEKDIFSLAESDLASFDVIVNAFGTGLDGDHSLHAKAADHFIQLLNGKEKPRLIVVGGAGSLFVDEQGTRVYDTPSFPEFLKPLAKGQAESLFILEKSTIKWTFLSPSASFEPGERTGTYQTGKDHLLVDASGNSRISMEDYAIAVVDEIERPKHLRQRFTVAAK